MLVMLLLCVGVEDLLRPDDGCGRHHLTDGPLCASHGRQRGGGSAETGTNDREQVEENDVRRSTNIVADLELHRWTIYHNVPEGSNEALSGRSVYHQVRGTFTIA